MIKIKVGQDNTKTMVNYRLKKKKILLSKYRSMDFCGKFSVHNVLDYHGNVVGQILKNYFGL